MRRLTRAFPFVCGFVLISCVIKFSSFLHRNHQSYLDAKLVPLRIPLKDILIATNNFAEDNLIERGAKVDVYKGLFLRSKVSFDVDIWKFGHLSEYGNESLFHKEINRLSLFKHKNFVSFIGFCDEKDERMIVMEHVVNGSLDRYISDPALTWSQRLHICIGVACALRYWKYDTSFYVKDFKILLDKDWEPKVLICYESLYDTENYDSGVYRLGMILLEVLIYGRKATIEDANLYRYEEVDDVIAPNLKAQVHPQSLSIFSETAYECLEEQPDQQHRDIYDQVVERLTEAFEIQWKHENAILMENFAHMKIPLSHIKLATDGFSHAYLIESHINEWLYKAELDHFDRGSVLTTEGENKCDLSKKPVIIKRFYYNTMSKDFFAKIEMLSNCDHPNLVSILGFCVEDSEMILVFECEFKETLHGYLRSASNMTDLTWERRIRISLDIAHVLKYLHNMGETQVIDSVDVFLDETFTAKIGNFRLDKFSLHEPWLWNADDIAPLIPSDQTLILNEIYHLGITLFEILTGWLDITPHYMQGNINLFASTVRGHFEKGELKNIADRRIMEETQELSYATKKGPNQDSFDTFSKIAYQCLVKTPSECPTLEMVIKSLEKALIFQVKNLEHLKVALKDIHIATNNFDEKYCIGFGGYGSVYKCSLELAEMASCTVAIKRIFSREDDLGKEGFLAELDVLSRCEHPNIVSLLGFCVEGNEMLLIYEHASNGSLDDYLGSTDKIINFTWTQRLNMCIDIAHGLNYLHTTMEDKRRIIHRDIKSANILLGKNWEAKIADFGLSKFFPVNHQASTINTNIIAGTYVYLDPEYDRTGSLKRASDIYSFGVVLFEIFSGTLAYASKYIRENERGLAPIARRHFKEGTLKVLMDPVIMDEAHELVSTLKVGPDQESLNAFSKIAYQCLAKTQAERPTIEEVIKELKEALKCQENWKDSMKISLEDIASGAKNFSDDNYIIGGGYGMLYKGEVLYINGHKVVVKRFHTSGEEHYFLRELEVLFKHKHENIIGLVGYCKELEEKIIVYENASNGCLCSYLNDTNFSWSSRLKICIDIAKGLKFLHEGDVGQDVVIHRDLKSSNILLTDDWKAKICGFEQCLTNQETEYVTNDVGSPGYWDPWYWETHTLTKESDIYSFGVILFEVLCGRLACPEDFKDSSQFLDVLVKHHSYVDRVDEIVYEGIKDQIVLKSLHTFLDIAFQCLRENRKVRPTADEVMVRLQKALEFQEASEIWEAKLPRNYKDILRFSKSHEIYSTMEEKDLYNILSKGLLLQDDKLWFSIGDNGERNEMITARVFSFKNRRSKRWQSIRESRFPKVAEMLDISNLNIQIRIRTQLLPLDVKYSVHLIFKFCGPRKSDARRMYVNLRYKMGKKNLHAYFATQREDNWMMIELCRYSNLKKDTNFEVLLEGFSRCYCDSRAIYIEGIEFRAIDHVKQENMEKLEEVQQVLISPSEMKREVYHMVSAESVVCDFSNSESSSQSSGEGIYKVPRRQVFCIKWHINEYQMMPPNIKCACYLVFKLSENCRGLHCPVIVRDQFHWKSKEIVYFRSPSPWNMHDNDRVPKKRRDGWMEVIVSKLNSDFVHKRGCLIGKLKLISYEGTMSGLIVRGLEFRPMEE